jgi:hypothetical protein
MVFGISAAIALNLAVQRKLDSMPFMRFTGRTGSFIRYSEIRKELAALPFSPPDPQMLRDNSVAFSNGSTTRVLFDRTYQPLRNLIAKGQLLDLVFKNGPHATYTLSNLPNLLAEELQDRIEAAYPDCVTKPDSVIEVTAHMGTKLKLPNNQMTFHQYPKIEEEERIAEAIAAHRDSHRFLRSEKQAQLVRDREDAKSKLPIVKVFSENYENKKDISAEERRAIEQFEEWTKKEHANMDNKFFSSLERLNAWKYFSDLFRCKTFADMAQSSPTAYKQLSDLLLKSYKSLGYSNEDSMRNDLNGMSLSSGTMFQIVFTFEDGRIGMINFPE